MKLTAVVRVDRRVPHEKYGKYYTISKKYQVHNPEGNVKVGDTVVFEECRPMSKHKRWRYIETVKTGKDKTILAAEEALSPAEASH